MAWDNMNNLMGEGPLMYNRSNFGLADSNVLNSDINSVLAGFNPSTGNTGSGFTNLGNWQAFSNVLNSIGGIANAYSGFKQLGLAKKQFNWQKDTFNTNLANQANLINAQLADRQARRVRNDPNATSVADYLNQFGVSGSIDQTKQRQKTGNAWTNSTALANVGG